RPAGCGRFRREAFTPISSTSLPLYCYCFCLRYEPRSAIHSRANDAAPPPFAAPQRTHQELEGKASEPPGSPRLATLLRRDEVSQEGHGDLRACLVAFFSHAVCGIPHGNFGGVDGPDDYGAGADELVRRRTRGCRLIGAWTVLPGL